MNDFSKKLRRGAEVTTCLLALALCASFALGLTSCENGTAAPIIITATNNELRFKSAKPRKSGWRHNFC